MKPLLIQLLITSLFPAHALKIERNYQRIWQISNFHDPQDVAVLTYMHDKINISFIDASVSYFSPDILAKLRALKRLTIFQGNVKQVHVKPELEALLLSSSKTEELLIVSFHNYLLQQLTVTRCSLTKIPLNIGRLDDLRELKLASNIIEEVTLEELNHLKKLELLDLSNNKIKLVDPLKNVHLPKLHTLRLDSNRLESLDICKWSMASLRWISLQNNSLSHVVDLQYHFPSLTHVGMYDNSFNCKYQTSFWKEARFFGIHFEGNRMSGCNTSNTDPFPEACPGTIELEQSRETSLDGTTLERFKQQSQILNEIKALAAKGSDQQIQRVEELTVKLEHKWQEDELSNIDMGTRLEKQSEMVGSIRRTVEQHQLDIFEMHELTGKLEAKTNVHVQKLSFGNEKINKFNILSEKQNTQHNIIAVLQEVLNEFIHQRLNLTKPLGCE